MLVCNLKVIMVQLNVKQSFLARKTGVSREAINRIANGAVNNPELEIALKIAQGLGVPVEQIWEVK